ncbi:site-2 protease family protein [Myxococcota bacterium]|nr:site-2 protease family protein [Myxococcota bacterium]
MDWLVARLTVLVPLWLSLSVHEWAHAWTANRLGDDTARLMGRMRVDPLVHVDWVGTVLLPLVGVPIGWAKPVPVNPLRFRGVHQDTGLLLAAGAGPASNLVLALLAALVHRPVALAPAHPVGSGLLALLAVAVPLNLGLAAFNLLPVPPLDGGRIVDGLVPYRWRPHWARLQVVGPFLLAALLIGAEVAGAGPLSALAAASDLLLGR